MNTLGSDAFVFFGTTGDLAYKKIFPALQALIKRGNFDIPIIGVARAGWTVDQLRMRAHDSLEHSGDVDAAAFAKLSALLQYIDSDYLFTTDESVEAAWRVVDPILEHPAPVAEYECGTWPAAAEAMIQGETGWHDTFTDNQE